MRVRRDLAIKKLLKIFLFNFLYIFTIKIFLKNTLLCLDSPKKERRRQVSAFPAIFKADFGRFRPVSAAGRYGRYGLILAESAQFGANPRKKKKKKTQTRTDAQATASDAASRVAPRQTQVQHLWCRVRAF